MSAAALLLVTRPGMNYAAATIRDYVNDHCAPFTLTSHQTRALARIRVGATLATPYVTTALFAFSRDEIPLNLDIKLSNELFDGRLTEGELDQVLRELRATALVTDCRPGRVNLSTVLSAEEFTEERYGCVAVYTRVAGDSG